MLTRDHRLARLATRYAAVVLALASLGLAACGESGEKKFRSDVNAICKQLDKDTANLNKVSDLAAIGREGRKAIPAITRAESKLKGLKVTKDVKDKFGDQYTEFLKTFLQTTSTLGQLIVVSEQGDRNRAQQLVQQGDQLEKRNKAQAKKLGFTECAK